MLACKSLGQAWQPLGLPALPGCKCSVRVVSQGRKQSSKVDTGNSSLNAAPPVKLKRQRKSKAVELPTDDAGEASIGPLRQSHCVRIPVGDRHIFIETGSIGRQAGGAVTITDGETILYTTVCASEEPSEVSDFIPLYVHYQERFSAVGRTSGGFNKRESRPQNHEIIISRLIDRPLRPMIPRGFFHEIQVLSWVLSYDGLHLPEPLAITAAGAALAISDIPLSKPVAGVRIGYVDGEFIINPTARQMRTSKLDMVLGGSSDSLLMIEGYSDFLPEEDLLKAIDIGQRAVVLICRELERFAAQFSKSKSMQRIRMSPLEIEQHIKTLVGDKLSDALHISSKRERTSAISALERLVWETLTIEGAASAKSKAQMEDENVWIDEEVEVNDGEIDQGDVHINPIPKSEHCKLFNTSDVKFTFKTFTSKLLRSIIVQEKVRSDGRGISDVREIQSSCGLISRAHGSAIFTRGETQALVVATLGDDSMGQRIDSITDHDELKRFYVQYVFPNSSVGEVGRIGAPSRREIGHGMLIERALEPAIPGKEEFSYTVRVESTITESNGSSSMASVCGATLALLDAGVPLKYPIAGVAMGLIMNPKEYGGRGGPVILTDILGSEDAFGDMDLKVAGTEGGITAFQMDVKTEGVTLSILKRVLSKAKTARRHILREMTKASPSPSSKLSKYVGLMETMKIGRDKIKEVIGSGGKTVRQIIEDSGVDNVVVKNDGSVQIIAKDRQKLEAAKEKILRIAFEPAVGSVYRNCLVKSLTSFGCFVELSPGREALCHISEMSTRRLAKVEDYVAVGEPLDVKVMEVNSRGQIRVSHRAVLEEDRAEEQRAATKHLRPSKKDKPAKRRAVASLVDGLFT